MIEDKLFDSDELLIENELETAFDATSKLTKVLAEVKLITKLSWQEIAQKYLHTNTRSINELESNVKSAKLSISYEMLRQYSTGSKSVSLSRLKGFLETFVAAGLSSPTLAKCYSELISLEIFSKSEKDPEVKKMKRTLLKFNRYIEKDKFASLSDLKSAIGKLAEHGFASHHILYMVDTLISTDFPHLKNSNAPLMFCPEDVLNFHDDHLKIAPIVTSFSIVNWADKSVASAITNS